MEENSTTDPEPKDKPIEEMAPPSEPSAPIPSVDPVNDLGSLDIEGGENEEQPLRPKDLIPKKNKKPSKKLVVILLILIAVATLGGGVFIFLDKNKSSKLPDNKTTETTKTSGKTATTTAETAKPKTFKSDTLKIELTYQSDWTLKEDVDKVVLSSPAFSYKKKNGTSTKNSFRLIIQKGINQVDSNTINNAVAVKISELIKYMAPAKDQRTETYLSFLGKTKDAFKFFLISSGKQYNEGEKVSGTLPLGQDSYVIAGGYGTNTDDSLGFDEIAIDKIDQDDAYSQAVDIVKSLKLY